MTIIYKNLTARDIQRRANEMRVNDTVGCDKNDLFKKYGNQLMIGPAPTSNLVLKKLDQFNVKTIIFFDEGQLCKAKKKGLNNQYVLVDATCPSLDEYGDFRTMTDKDVKNCIKKFETAMYDPKIPKPAYACCNGGIDRTPDFIKDWVNKYYESDFRKDVMTNTYNDTFNSYGTPYYIPGCDRKGNLQIRRRSTGWA